MAASTMIPGQGSSVAARFADGVRVVQKPGLLEAEVDGEIVALHIESGKCYGMNEVAARIWSLLATPHSVREIRDALMARYAVEDDECREQVASLLSQLEGEGLIEVAAH